MQKSNMWAQITPSYIFINIFSSEKSIYFLYFRILSIKFCISGKILFYLYRAKLKQVDNSLSKKQVFIR